MNKKTKTLLILSCIFATITLLISFANGYMSFGMYSLLWSHPEDLGEALGVIFGLIIFIAYTILLGIAVLVTGGLTIGFVIPLMKLDGKKWYSIVMLVVAIVAIVLAVLFVAMLPVVSNAHNAANNSSSSSSMNSSSDPITESAFLFL